MPLATFTIEPDPKLRLTFRRSVHGTVILVRPPVASSAVGAARGKLAKTGLEELCIFIRNRGKNAHDFWSLLCAMPDNSAAVAYRCNGAGIRFNCGWINKQGTDVGDDYVESDTVTWQQLSGLLSFLTGPCHEELYLDVPVFGLS